MSRLIVISNRVSAPRPDDPKGAQGGLSVALAAALREYRGIWFGWSGNKVDEFTGHIDLQRHGGVTTATIDLEAQDVEEYYNGYANRTLWPLFHYRIDLAEYDRSFAGGYERVNERFAETASPLIEPDDLVWVHDYHLIPLGAQLRERGLRNRMGFFLHIPFPPSRLMVSLPFHEGLVLSLLAYDVIGFQTEEWLESFRHYVERELGGHCEPDGTIHVGDRSVHAAAYPIGIDYQEFCQAATSERATQAYDRLKKSADGRHTIIGVDRLDYSKGMEERFLGYRRFLEEHGDCRGKLFLLQIAPPSRGEVHTYEIIREDLDELSGRINGEFAEVDWVPIRYVNQGYAREDLAGFYRAAEMALVTPLRDGMNLVAKEYVAAQDPDNPGVLILSRFAGAALQMKDAILI
ncbi:MAG: trehalose-6-phosphate synthase, partial [Pseudomonadota bacterium]|nr:trehalose-6-phosphate synthase [Pseudomonadota bacterium]